MFHRTIPILKKLKNKIAIIQIRKNYTTTSASGTQVSKYYIHQLNCIELLIIIILCLQSDELFQNAWNNAKPYNSIPGPNIWKLFWRFLPGGIPFEI